MNPADFKKLLSAGFRNIRVCFPTTMVQSLPADMKHRAFVHVCAAVLFVICPVSAAGLKSHGRMMSK